MGSEKKASFGLLFRDFNKFLTCYNMLKKCMFSFEIAQGMRSPSFLRINSVKSRPLRREVKGHGARDIGSRAYSMGHGVWSMVLKIEDSSFLWQKYGLQFMELKPIHNWQNCYLPASYRLYQ
jgi:hypothetical protein